MSSSCSMPVVISPEVKYILLRFVRVNCCYPAVKVLPLADRESEVILTETLLPSVVSNVR